MKSKIDKKFYKLTLEKLVIGLEEPILVKGIGKLNAKIDSGNGGYNVLHGTNFVRQGDILSFETEDGEGNRKNVSKKIKSSLNVNIGGGHIQERPVIELDVQFAGDTYKKIPFSITDRGDNEHKVLISKDFVGKELQALIDVNKTNISDDAIDVDYVSEGFKEGMKKIVGSTGKAANAVFNNRLTMGSETGEKFKNWASNFKKSMLGQGATPPKKKVEIKDELEKIGNLQQILESDKELIKNKLPEIESDLEDAKIDVSLNGDDVSIFKIIDYTGGTNYNDIQADKEFKNKTKKIIKELKNKKPVNEAAEQQPYQENIQPTATSENANKNENGQPESQTQEQQTSAENDVNIESLSAEELEAYKKDILARNEFVFYYVAFNKSKDGLKSYIEAPEYFKDSAAKEAVRVSAKPIFTSRNYTITAFEKAAQNISRKISQGYSDAAGIFVLCSGKMGSRTCEFITKWLIGAANEKNKKDKLLKQLAKKYKEIQEIYEKLTAKIGVQEEMNADNIKNIINKLESQIEYVENRPQ